MDLLTVVTILLLVGTTLLLVLYPLWQQTRPDHPLQPAGPMARTREEVQALYQAKLAAIKDLTFDYEMGKVSAEDYESLLAKSKLEAAHLRQQLDQMAPDLASPALDPEIEAEIESLVARVRQKDTIDDKNLEREVRAEIEHLKEMPLDGQGSGGPACSSCGKQLQVDDSFCSSCGQPVPEEDQVQQLESGLCPQCGYTLQPDDAFCAKCGTALDEFQVQNYEDARI